MPNDDPTPTDGQPQAGAPEGGQPQAGDPGGTPAADGQAPTPEPTLEDLPEAAQRIIRDTRAEAANYRRRLREFETEAEQRRQAELSELERERERAEAAERRLEEAQRAAREARLESVAVERAGHLGYIAPGIAPQLIRFDDVEWDDDGRPTNTEALLAAILERHPELARQPAGDLNSGRRPDGTPGGQDMNALLRARAGRA